MDFLTRTFRDHPNSVNETYLQHLVFASTFAGKLAQAALVAMVHAILPFLFEKTASRIIAELYRKTHNRD